MTNKAILVGNCQYRFLTDLACCHDDLLAIRELLEAAEKYSEIELIENADADELKSRIRGAVDKGQTEELLFYFTGHGFQQENDFYYCATGFDSKRPNETGLSNDELHTLLRLGDAELVVKIIDACNSGTLLVKADAGFIPQQKAGFKNLIQISSCLQSQNSLTGNPLSVFTEKLRSAALRKTDGAIFYTDIIYALRDEFIDNNDQTPFFVAQGTGREQFVDDAKRLDALRARLATTTIPSLPPEIQAPQSPPPATLRDLLQKAELSMGNWGSTLKPSKFLTRWI